MNLRSLVAALLAVALLAVPLAAIVVTRVTVATTQTLVYTAASGGSRILIRNPGAASVYLGATGVLTTTGFELAAGDAVMLPLEPNDLLYGIVATGTVIVHTAEASR
jgi:hypothetical protein